MKLVNIKIAKLFYWCGWGEMCTGVTFIIWGAVAGGEFLMPGIAKGISGLLIGFGFNKLGASEIKRFKRESGEPGETQRKFLKLKTFQKENCVDCRFAEKEVLGKPIEEAIKHQGWCTRPEPPECDEDYCYSRERRED
jgi:hypothetical protein